MSRLHQSKCLNHPDREAIARCPECKNFFCRECITEHHGKLTCTACLTAATAPVENRRTSSFRRLIEGTGTLLKTAVSFLTLWLTVYTVGRLLLLIPDSFHSGDLWEAL